MSGSLRGFLLTLVFGPPDLPTWASYLILIINSIVLITLFRRNIAPSLLAKLSKHLRARSISMRSIRGLYVRSKDRTWRIERISWSVSIRSQKHISIKVTGLSLELTPSSSRSRRPSVGCHSRNLGVQLSKVFRGILQTVAATIPSEQARKIRRSIQSVYTKTLVTLIQTMNFELDTVVISSSSFPGMQVVIGNITFNSTINFLPPLKEAEPSFPVRRSRRRFSMAMARDFFTARRDVAVSMTIDISEIIGKTLIMLPQDLDKSSHGPTAVNDENIFLHVPGIAHSKLDFSYDPLTHGLCPATVITSFQIPRCDIFLDKIASIPSSTSGHDDLPSILPSPVDEEDTYEHSRKPTPQTHTDALRSLSIQTGCVNLFHLNSSYHTLLLAIKNLDLVLWPSDGSSSSLHGSWLGSKDRGFTLGLTIRVDQIKIHRCSPETSEIIHCFLVINRIDFNSIFHKWPTELTFMPSRPDTIHDPLVVWEISLGDIHMTEQFRLFLINFEVSEKKQPPKRSFPATMFPKFHLNFLCHVLTMDFYDGEHVSSSRLICSLNTSNINFHVDIAVDDINPAPSFSEGRNQYTFLAINMCLSTEPVCIRSCLKSDNLDNFTGPDPLITIDHISGCITSHLATSHTTSTDSITIHPEDSIIYLKVFTDNILLDLWRKDNVSLLRSLRRILPSSKTRKPEKAMHPPFNYTIHIGIHHATLAVTGVDINPNCNLELSRGLEFDGGWSLEIVNLHRPSGNLKVPKEVLDEELVKDAQAENRDMLSFSCSLWDFTCYSITANPFEYGRNKSSRGDTFSSLLQISRLHLMAFPSNEAVIVKVINPDTTIQTHVDFLGVYSVLIVHQTFQQCINSEIRSDQPSLSMAVIFRVELHALNIKCSLPLAQEIFIRVEGIFINNSLTSPLNALAMSVEGYIPNSRDHEEWHTLLKLSHTTLQMVRNIEQKLVVAAHGLRFSIPHGFIFSELLVNLTVAIKALRHLRAVVRRGHHIPFPVPSAEIAKTLPEIDIRVQCLVLEAMDNPLDGKIGRISRIGPMAQRLRLEREQAFKVKVRNLRMDKEMESDGVLQDEPRYRFTSKRTVSISDAQDRLQQVHALSWFKAIFREEKRICSLEESLLKTLGQVQNNSGLLPIFVRGPEKIPALFCATFNGFDLHISPFKESTQNSLPSELGKMPKSTQYTLFIPFHMRCVFDGARILIRDYPLPLFNLPVTSGRSGLEFETDIVIAEELGSPESVEWFVCPIVPNESHVTGCEGYYLDIPKTIMPVKSYADLQLKFHSAVTEFTWSISYSPAIQDILRIIETLTPTSVDPSPPIGFWDKIRLVLHWRVAATFDGMACLHFKGSRDPYQISGLSTGFDFRWDQNVILRMNHKNAEGELIQLISDSMAIMIPCSKSLLNVYKVLQDDLSLQWDPSITWCPDEYEKLCAEFSHGIKWGIGFVLERTCNSTSCHLCHGDPFNRSCRFFTFSPHHEVVLRKRKAGHIDSYYGFRSNFIHLSTSLVSPLKEPSANVVAAFHLTPKTFTHFWSWWSLFDDGISLPIRQGRIFPDSRLPTQKFSQHLATVKYRIEFSSIFIAHTYKLDTAEDWKQGTTRCIGIKTFLDSFQADLHQRLEEKARSKRQEEKSKVVRHKPFYAVDVILTGLDLRAVMARFVDPDKRLIDPDVTINPTKDLDAFTSHSSSSDWIDLDDFKETDWEMPETEPTVYLYQTAFCPRFVYFKRVPADLIPNSSIIKFGDEETHVCLMGKEPSVQEVQHQLGIKRLRDLKVQMVAHEQRAGTLKMTMSDEMKEHNVKRMINLLEEYVQYSSASKHSTNYIPADIVVPEEIQHFVNVYQVHCPVIHLNNATRDILHEYYAASRARRGFEYHLSARAVKFIRDQELQFSTEEPISHQSRSGSANIAAKAVKRMLIREDRRDPDDLKEYDSLVRWGPGISERKAHLCLLLKPQVVLQSNLSKDFILLLAADHVVLRNHGIVDEANIDDPVSGHIMQRNFANINGLQLFQPVNPELTTHLPFEVFLDVRSESRDFKRIVPQTHATLRYDRFNKLRLRNNVTTLNSTLKQNQGMMDHLLYEMDLLGIEVPRFSVTADASTFAAISSIVNDLLLFSDPARKARSLQLEAMIFGYDFTSYHSAAKVVSDLQSRLRSRLLLDEFYRNRTPIPVKDTLENRAYILKLSEELNMIFDAFKLAQIKTDDRSHDKKSALRLHTSSSEISWRMLGDNRELLAKLAVRGIDFSWLRRQDSSTTSVLQVEDLQAFDGSPNALWPEILTKYNEPVNHHMIKRGLFMNGQWSVLAPVGGISIYSDFKIELHPIRLTLETQLGNKILAYILPNRRGANRDSGVDPVNITIIEDSPPSPQSKRRLLTSRSLSNLTLINSESDQTEYHAPGLPRCRSSTALITVKNTTGFEDRDTRTKEDEDGDVYQMRHRSSQKTFVHAEIPSVHVLLSIVKGGNFLIRDARIRTHDLEWRNRTSSLEELIEHFVPSDPSWRGWIKVAWQQPIFSVGTVVKELVTKTQWGRIGKHPEEDEKKPNRT